MTMVFVCLTLCSMMTGLLLTKIRRETGWMPRVLYSFALLAIGFCTTMATTIAIALSRVSMGEVFTTQLITTLLATMAVGLLIPIVVEKLRKSTPEALEA